MNCGEIVLARQKPPFDERAWQRDVILRNVAEDPNYAPYCLPCPGLVRMVKIDHLFWHCERCGAQHDERTP